MRLVSTLCAAALVRRGSLRGPEPTCECRAANFSALLTNGTLPVTHAMLYPASEGKETYAFPGDYGSACQAWDKDVHPACRDTRHPPSWCLAEWCYVDPSCLTGTSHTPAGTAPADVLQTINFGNQPLYYSYATCGSVDTATPESCLQRNKASCLDTPSCAWQAADELCQSSLCQCQGGELPSASNFAADYGSTCGAWDHDRCRAFAHDEEGRPADESLGLWCCMSFCFVDAKCPSATKHPALEGKFVSYVACPSDRETLQECPAGSKAVDAHGDPLPISSEVSAALEHQLHEAREEKLRAQVKPTPLHAVYKDEEPVRHPGAPKRD